MDEDDEVFELELDDEEIEYEVIEETEESWFEVVE